MLRAVHGLFYALFGTAISAMTVDSLPESRRSEGMGWFGAAYVFGAVAGPALGVYLSDEFGFRIMFLTAATLAAIGFVMGLLLEGGESPASWEGEGPRLSPGSFISVRCIPYALLARFIFVIWPVLCSCTSPSACARNA